MSGVDRFFKKHGKKERERRHRHLTLGSIIASGHQKSVPKRVKCIRWELSVENMARTSAETSWGRLAWVGLGHK